MIDGKKMGLDKSMNKIPVSTIMEEARKKIVASLKLGNPIIVALTKSVTDFATTFNDVSASTAATDPLDLSKGSFIPIELFQLGGKKLLEEDMMKSLFREDELEQGMALCRSPDTFHVVVTSQFQPEDFEEYLFSNDYGLPKPKEQYQFIVVNPPPSAESS